MFLLGVRENICTAPFLDAQELHFWITLKANVCIFLYISARNFFSHWRSNILFDGGGLEEGWMIPEGNSLFGSRKMFYNFSFWLKFFKIQLFFSILTLPSIALKRWNFPDKLDYKGKIVAKFLIRIHFLTI